VKAKNLLKDLMRSIAKEHSVQFSQLSVANSSINKAFLKANRSGSISNNEHSISRNESPSEPKHAVLTASDEGSIQREPMTEFKLQRSHEIPDETQDAITF